MNKLTPYILPIISIIIVSIFLVAKPKGITGFTVLEPSREIKITSTRIIPKNSIVEIEANNQTLKLTIEEFIKKSKTEPTIIYSELKEIDYKGEGYIGNYSVDFELLNLDKGAKPTVYIVYNNLIISKNK
jgi:hypothetical protein